MKTTKKKYDSCEVQFQLGNLVEVIGKMIKQSEKQTFTSDGNAIRNKIRIGKLAELYKTLRDSEELIRQIREYPIDDLEVDL